MRAWYLFIAFLCKAVKVLIISQDADTIVTCIDAHKPPFNASLVYNATNTEMLEIHLHTVPTSVGSSSTIDCLLYNLRRGLT